MADMDDVFSSFLAEVGEAAPPKAPEPAPVIPSEPVERTLAAPSGPAGPPIPTGPAEDEPPPAAAPAPISDIAAKIAELKAKAASKKGDTTEQTQGTSAPTPVPPPAPPLPPGFSAPPSMPPGFPGAGGPPQIPGLGGPPQIPGLGGPPQIPGLGGGGPPQIPGLPTSGPPQIPLPPGFNAPTGPPQIPTKQGGASVFEGIPNMGGAGQKPTGVSTGASNGFRGAAGKVWKDEKLMEWPENDFRLFIGNIGKDATEELMAKSFANYSSLNKVRIVRDKRNTKRHKGYGFVSFMDGEDMLNALNEMNGAYIGIRPITLKLSKWKQRSVEEKTGTKSLREQQATGGKAKRQKRYHLHDLEKFKNEGGGKEVPSATVKKAKKPKKGKAEATE